MKKFFALVLGSALVLSCAGAFAADYEMIVGHAQPEGNPRYVSMEKFAADVGKLTNGHVKVSVFGNGQLGTEKEMLEQV
ncbi:MAG: C4-dicarboxylate ABC transporter substrate-binding protein, partial [Synergistaceae bacterium]|nr:C4-dicarboxylate ABC transporter substrate-binding protein [Synergistaceae bacterium]